MSKHHDDLSIDDVLADPIIRAVMKADRVDAGEFRVLLGRAAEARRRSGRCLDLSFGRVRPRSTRSWASLMPPSRSGTDCGAPLPW